MSLDREFLKGLGIEAINDEVAEKILAEHGKTIQAEQDKVKSKADALTKANETITGLQDKIKKFDGVDIESLKTAATELQTKYDTDTADLKKKLDETTKTYSLKDALKSAGVQDPDYLIYKHGGIDKFAFSDEGKPVGIDETIKPYRESSPSLFQAAKPQREGQRQNNGEQNPDKKEEANEAIRSLL